MDYELVIIGAGPAGLSAAIYASRSGIDNVVLDSASGGGMVPENPVVENYPGFPEISGMELAEKFKEHARKYTELQYRTDVENITKEDSAFTLNTDQGKIRSKAIIFATGTKHRHLDIEGEKEFRGKGISYCATCDGPLFNGSDLVVIGGGSTALTETLYLNEMDDDREITLVHRRDQFRGEEALVEKLKRKKVNLKMKYNPVQIYGDDFVKGVKVENVETGKEEDISCEGVFVSIGEIPQNDLAVSMGVEVDEKGYIETDEKMETNISGVYAAGDVTGGIRQIVTAVSEGAIAALNSLATLGKDYPY